jgi:hypothetical protein
MKFRRLRVIADKVGGSMISLLIPLIYIGSAFNQPQVIGGLPVELEDPVASYTVAVITPDPSISDRAKLCTGVVVGRRWILSARHCLVDVKTDKPYIFFSREIERPAHMQDAIRADKVVAHYDANSDLVMIHLPHDVPEDYLDVVFAHDAFLLKEENLVRVAGFGTADLLDPNSAGTLRSVTLKVSFPVTQQLIHLTRTGSDHDSACFGDSGGPAFYDQDGDLILVGIGRLVDSSTCQADSYYRNVGLYSDWITGVLNGQG